ncbi:hypothetical protein BIV57_22425 [Mangrovactinospora gilvigrisea]|uniref:N-acetylmuramoyl-L-alanine amidase n=1 Tax=Mangrovactinospora gilvigrisea TaxID=1428644 RepID=A0A1J7B9F5_9ACTN|nr:peptidoglycan recognition family protein [Mangrovactinospora gilvigrisea]OIV35275.1 hypothetical protein BIV57_22425 [Mangrovactinospora gilvigrisea]
MSPGHRSSTRRKRRRIAAVAGTAAAAVAAVVVAQAASGSSTPSGPPPAAAAGAALHAPSRALQADFASAAAEFHVPESVLLAVSYQQTLWETHQGKPSMTGNYNVMGLTDVTRAELDASTGPELGGTGDLPRKLRNKGGTAATARAAKPTADSSPQQPITPAMRTLATAASLIKADTGALKSSARQSVRGGAALLASYQRAATGSAPGSGSDPAAWTPAIERFSGAQNAVTAKQFADRVLATVRTGAQRVTSDNQALSLAADSSVPARSDRTAVSPDLRDPIRQGDARAGAATQAATTATPTPECPSTLTCTFKPAAYQQTSTTDPTNYGNYDLANRPADGGSVDTIVIHDTESSLASAISTFQDPKAHTSAHYVVGADGSVTQMVQTKNIARHAGNWYTNAHSIGIEHEGYALTTGSWYTEQEYQSSAALVKYLGSKFGISLDRTHVIGHDGVPGPLDAYYTGMHWDPGTWWNWSHYLALMGAAPNGNGMPVVGGTVTIAPPWSTSYEPTVTGCGSATTACPAHQANFVYLRTSPSSSAALIKDPYFTAKGIATGTTVASDWTAKAVYGQTFAVADVSGDWTAIWYDGQKAWFNNPGGAYTMANTRTAKQLITPAGSTAVPVYGRAYPETSAYPAALSSVAGDPNQQLTPFSKETIQPGQSYPAAASIKGDYYYSENFNCTATPDCLVVAGTTAYYPITYNHRIAYVKASDVTVTQPNTPPTGTLKPVTPTRVMDTRDGTGGVPKAKVGTAAKVTLQVTGQAGVPSSGVTAAVLNVTATGATANSYASVYPDGTTRTSASNLNFKAGQTIPNLVTVPIVNGKVDFYNNAGSVNLIADLVGYYTSDGSGSKLNSLNPTRIMDTRNGTGGVPTAKVGAAKTVSLTVAGKAGVPATGVSAVVMNVTATGATASSYVSVFPDGTTRTSASNLNFPASTTIANLVVVPVVNGKVDFYNNAGSVNLIADITGWFGTASGSIEHNAGPVRVMDTRNGTGVSKGAVGAAKTVTLTVGGKNGVPTDATAVVLNVTATGGTATSYVTVYPSAIARPTASNLNFYAAENISNLVMVPISSGKVTFYNSSGSVNLVADLVGYFTK